MIPIFPRNFPESDNQLPNHYLSSTAFMVLLLVQDSTDEPLHTITGHKKKLSLNVKNMETLQCKKTVADALFPLLFCIDLYISQQ